MDRGRTPAGTFRSAHLPGALGIELADDFGTWVGWLLPFDAPLVLVLESDQDLEEARVQLARIGFEHVRGVLRGVDAWRAEGRRLRELPTLDVETFARALTNGDAGCVLDVRSPAEWQAGSLPGSTHGIFRNWFRSSLPSYLRTPRSGWCARAVIAPPSPQVCWNEPDSGRWYWPGRSARHARATCCPRTS